MALPMIETGYKPEFGLGAVYQGFNAANADNSAELEIIKQFLANQREQQMQPLDVNIKQTESDRATVGRSPDMLDAYQRGYIGQNNSQDAAGQKAMALLPFQIAAEQAKAKRDTSSDNLFGRMFGNVEKQYDKSLPKQERNAAATEAVALANTLKQNDPKFLQQQQLREMSDDTKEYIAEINNQRALQAAQLRGSGGKDPYQEFYKLTPERRLGIVEWALSTGINPITQQPMAVSERDTWKALYNQDLQTYNARNASNAKEGSIPIDAVTKGAIPTRPAITAGTPKVIGNGMPVEDRSGQGVTKSGNKFTITKE